MTNELMKSKVITTKSKTVITSFDNDHEQICVKNKFTADDKVYNE